MDTKERAIKILRITDVLGLLGLSRSCFYDLVAREVYPATVHLSVRATGVPEHAHDAWVASRIAVRLKMKRPRDKVSLSTWSPEREVGNFPSGIRFLRLCEVVERVGLSTSQIYRLIGNGKFPAPVPLTEGARRWLEHEIQDWLKSRIAFSLQIAGVRRISHSRDNDRPSA